MRELDLAMIPCTNNLDLWFLWMERSILCCGEFPPNPRIVTQHETRRLMRLQIVSRLCGLSFFVFLRSDAAARRAPRTLCW